MKVYIAGSHSCGKTTLAHYISKKYNLPMISEVARQVLSERELHIDSLRHNLDLVDSYQAEVFYRQLKEESKHDSFVSDRTIDNLAYAAQHSRILPKLLVSEELQTYVSKLRENDSTIFFVRPSKVTLKMDGVRESLTWDGVIAIDAMVKFLLEMYRLPYYQINMDNMQERVRLIDTVLIDKIK
jgi:cytidylate kinase